MTNLLPRLAVLGILCQGSLLLAAPGQKKSSLASGRLVVRSIPEGATILVDNIPIGAADVEYGVSSGKHVVIGELGGYRAARREIVIAPGEQQVVTLFLFRPEESQESQKSSVGAWKWVTLGASVLAIAAGVTLLAIGDSERSSNGARLPEANDNVLLGALLLGAGAATGGLSAYLFYKDRAPPVEGSLSGLGFRVATAF